MDHIEQHIQRRKSRYMAQALEAFERDIEPYLTDMPKDQVEKFKSLTRNRFNCLATDAAEAHELVNGAAQQIREQLSANGHHSKEHQHS